MTAPRLVATGIALLVVVVGCTDGRDATGPTSPARSPAGHVAPAHKVQASGHFDANVDFSTLTLTPRGSNCLLVVKGQLVFTGTIEGVADATTTALVFAPCAAVATTPPGTYPDVFNSVLAFTGTVNGVRVQANGLYVGRSQPGGAIAAHFVFAGGMAGVLEVDARIAVGGTYEGAVVVR